MEGGGPQEDVDAAHEQPRASHWYTDPRALVGFSAGVVGLAIGITTLAGKFDDDPPRVSAQYIVDVSQEMSGQIGDRPKLPAVTAEVLSQVKNTPSLSTALRLAGPSCSSGYREPDVRFDEDNGDEFEKVLSRVKARGRSDFANAVRHAASDFISNQDPASSTSKTLYIFVGGRDTCSSRPVEVVRRALRDLRVNKDIELSLKFVGVKVSPEVKEFLKGVRKEAQSLGYRADVHIADKTHELETALPEQGPSEQTPCEALDPESHEYMRRCR